MEENDQSALKEFVPLDSVNALAQEWLTWIQNTLLTFDVAVQLGLIVAAIVPAAMFGHLFKDFVQSSLGNRVDIPFVNRLVDAIAILGVPLILYFTIAMMNLGLGSADRPTEWVAATIALMNAWIVVRMVTLVIQSPFWSSFMSPGPLQL